jgi:hypothetical protein
MKVVINTCYGGFSLSTKAVKKIAKLQGRECYAFKRDSDGKYVAVGDEEQVFVTHFDTMYPNHVFASCNEDWASSTTEERQRLGRLYNEHFLTNRPENRSDPLLVQVVEELGEEANGSYAKLKIVEIPDDVEYTIDEYDGVEHIAEKHRTWE